MKPKPIKYEGWVQEEWKEMIYAYKFGVELLPVNSFRSGLEVEETKSLAPEDEQ